MKLEKLQEQVNEAFEYLGQYPKINTYAYEYTKDDHSIKIRTKTYVNGKFKAEGEGIEGFVSPEEAMELTQDCIAKLQKEYSHIFVRKMPEIYKHDTEDSYVIYMRLLAFNEV